MRKGVVIGVLLLVAAACDRAGTERDQTPPGEDRPQVEAASGDVTGFSHDLSVDPSGFYMPVSEARAGVWRLDHIAVSDAAALAAWEGGERAETFAPIMMQFDDATSPVSVNELGGEYHQVTARVLPEAYEVTDERVRFRGRAPGVGLVTFDGVLNADALETAQRSLGGSDGAVLTGTLTVGGQVFEGQSFLWWMGD